ncbi:hypothetical protein B0H19DRAFT_1079039 [Mycena capillaripes]|nr:hypothetical protein B0H19DRAFT_1079039 [Mycena capillaripes]
MSVPALPSELEREIFELNAMAHPKIEPLLYSVVLLRSERSPFHRTLLKSKHLAIPQSEMAAAVERLPASFFGAHVRHLFLDSYDYNAYSRTQETMLNICTGVINVMLLNIRVRMRTIA